MPRIDLERLIAKMRAKGMTPLIIARVLDLDEDEVLAVPFTTEVLSGGPEELGSAMQDLAWRAYYQAVDLLEHGTIPVRMALIRTIYSRTSAYLRQTEPHELESLRAAFQDMIEQATLNDDGSNTNGGGESPSNIIEIPAVEITSLGRTANNPRQIRGTETD